MLHRGLVGTHAHAHSQGAHHRPSKSWFRRLSAILLQSRSSASSPRMHTRHGGKGVKGRLMIMMHMYTRHDGVTGLMRTQGRRGAQAPLPCYAHLAPTPTSLLHSCVVYLGRRLHGPPSPPYCPLTLHTRTASPLCTPVLPLYGVPCCI